jgi:hypothetical protein
MERFQGVRSTAIIELIALLYMLTGVSLAALQPNIAADSRAQ